MTLTLLPLKYHLKLHPNMLTQLPQELLELICQQCTQESLRDLRLVDKRTNTASTPLVFERMYVSTFTNSISKLGHLSRSLLSKHVKAIDFIPDRMPAWNKRDWTKAVDFRPPFSAWCEEIANSKPGVRQLFPDRTEARKEYDRLPRHDFTQDQMKAGWLAFEANRDAQHRWFAGGQGLELKEYVSSLPNLREAVIRKVAPFNGRVNDKPFWKHLRRQILVGPDAWLYGTNLQGEDTFEGILAVIFLEAIGYRNTFAGMRPVEVLSLDLVTRWSLASLRLLVTNEFGSGEPMVPSVNPLDRLGIAVDAFRTLKHLSLSCPHVPDHINIALDGPAQETQALLLAATELRTLTLEYGEPAVDRIDENDGQHMFQSSLASFLSKPSIIYPHLQELKITASIPAEAFAKFLGYHSRTLRVLELRDSVCDDWEAVLMTISKVLNLQRVYLECLHEILDEQEEEGGGGGEEAVVRTVSYFWEGTDEENDFNSAMKAYLLEGKGTIPDEFYKQSCVDVD